MNNNISLTGGMRESLYSIQLSNSLLETIGNRLSTGKKVNSVLDDPINYYRAKEHRDRAADLMVRKDEMSEAVQTIKEGTTGIESLENLVDTAKSLATSAMSADTTVEINNLESQFNALMTQIDELASDSGYKGINLLDGTDDTLKVSFDETGDSAVTLTGFDGSASGLGLSTLSTNDWTTASNITDSISELDSAKTTLRSESKTLSTNLNTIKIRQDFTDKTIKNLNDGSDNLILADMDEEAANYLAVQTQQALARNTLSLASQNAQSVLRLF